MSDKDAVIAALEDMGLPAMSGDARNLSGGCIHRVFGIPLAHGSTVVAKINSADQLPLFQEEAAGLTALGETRTVLVPTPIGAGAYEGHAVLFLTELKRGRATDDAWRAFGGQLAALHQADPATNGRYGFHADNHLGITFQPNTFHDDWVEFNAIHRLGFQVELARNGGHLQEDEVGRIRRLIDRLEQFIPRKPRPSLLHGDLWAGNAIPCEDEPGSPVIGVIDPACYVGDGYCDLAMMRLFSGFPGSCFQAYSDAVDDHDRVEERIAVYQLYHLLNHVNIFGRDYASQAMSVVAQLGC